MLVDSVPTLSNFQLRPKMVKRWSFCAIPNSSGWYLYVLYWKVQIRSETVGGLMSNSWAMEVYSVYNDENTEHSPTFTYYIQI